MWVQKTVFLGGRLCVIFERAKRQSHSITPASLVKLMFIVYIHWPLFIIILIICGFYLLKTERLPTERTLVRFMDAVGIKWFWSFGQGWFSDSSSIATLYSTPVADDAAYIVIAVEHQIILLHRDSTTDWVAVSCNL